MKRNKGITLIALIITILVMLILVGVTVNVIINSNILGSAKNAGKKWKDEAQKEATEGKITISGIEYESIDEYVSLSQASLPGGTRVETPTPYTVGGKTAVIPAGFTVSGIKSERTIDGGLVIYDIPKADLEAAGEEFWTAKEKVDDENSSDYYTVQKNYNQFVWVPVETPYVTASELAQIISNSNGSITTETAALQSLADNGIYPMAVQLANGTDYRGVVYKFNGKDSVKIKVSSFTTTEDYENGTVRDYREPAKLTTASSTYVDQTKEESLDLQTEYNNIVKSVANQKGFWVARYELSYNTTTNKGESKRGNTVAKSSDTNTNQWYGLYNACQGMYTGTTKSAMISGSQWDQIMIWMKEVKNTKGRVRKYYILDGSYMGNYKTSTGGTEIEQVSGYKENYAVRQVFDLGGNLLEWTTSAVQMTNRVCRGGQYSSGGNEVPPSEPQAKQPIWISSNGVSARTVLYVTL